MEHRSQQSKNRSAKLFPSNEQEQPADRQSKPIFTAALAYDPDLKPVDGTLLDP